MGSFLKRYSMSLMALIVALIVIFFILNLIGKRAPGFVGSLAERTGSLASGQAYSFRAV